MASATIPEAFCIFVYLLFTICTHMFIQFSSNPYELFVGGLLYLTLAAGISKVRWIGVEGDHNALVMDVMGLSLEIFFNCCSKKFSLKTVLMLAEKMVDMFFFHECIFFEIQSSNLQPDYLRLEICVRSIVWSLSIPNHFYTGISNQKTSYLVPLNNRMRFFLYVFLCPV